MGLLGLYKELDPRPLGVKGCPLLFPSSLILAEVFQDFLRSVQVILQFSVAGVRERS